MQIPGQDMKPFIVCTFPREFKLRRLSLNCVGITMVIIFIVVTNPFATMGVVNDPLYNKSALGTPFLGTLQRLLVCVVLKYNF